MVEIRGTTVNGGKATGPAFVLPYSDAPRNGSSATDAGVELRRIERAAAMARARLEELMEKAAREVGSEAAGILEVQRYMLDDPDYREMIQALVRDEGATAEDAVLRTGEHFAKMFSETGDDCLLARAADVRDVSNLVAACLSGSESELPVKEPSVLVAEEIVPSELVRIDRRMILATVSRRGSVNSHASIIARALGIPAVVNAPIDFGTVCTGLPTFVDGMEGRVVFDPDEQTVRSAADASPSHPEDRRAGLARLYAGKLELTVNISGPGDIADGLPAAFAGVGLFRTEFLYLGRHDLPGEEEQYRVFRKTLELTGGRKVVARTFDLGADKAAEALPCGSEANPALGCRGIRLALSHPEVFEVQIRALLRAAAYGDLRIMYPMVTSCEEVLRAREIVDGVAHDLERAAIPFRVPPQGVMIETPAAALISDKLAETADFFSVGTNDLTQYTLAADREGAAALQCFNPRHPAVLELLRLIAHSAHKAGIAVSICGELAADPEMAETFLDLHIDSLSV